VRLDSLNVVGAGCGAGAPLLLDVVSNVHINFLEVGLNGCIGATAGFLTTIAIKRFLKWCKVKID